MKKRKKPKKINSHFIYEKNQKKEDFLKNFQKNICVKMSSCCIVLFPFNAKKKGKSETKSSQRCFDSRNEVIMPNKI